MSEPTRESIPLSPIAAVVLPLLVLAPLLVGAGMMLSEGGPVAGAAGMVATGLGVLAVLALLMLPNRIEYDRAELRLRSGLARHRVSLSALDPALMRRVDLAREPGLAPRWRSFGTSIPGGFNTGWFGLQDRRKAFVLAHRRDRLTVIEAPDGIVLLLALEDPERLRRAIVAARA